MKFCNKTRGLNEEQNTQYAKDLKEFNKKEAEKFRTENPNEVDSDE